MYTEEEMGMSEMNASSQTIDLNSIRSRIMELRQVDECPKVGSNEDEIRSLAIDVEKEMDRVFSEGSSYLSTLSSEELDEALVQLKEVWSVVESENAGLERETVELQEKCSQENEKMEGELEKLCCLLQFTECQKTLNKEEDALQIDFQDDSNFKMQELSLEIEMKKKTLKSLQDLGHIYRRLEAVERLEGVLSGLKVIEAEENTIRLSLKTCVPYTQNILHLHDVDDIDPLEVHHELMIETVDGTFDLKRVEIFPNDVHITEIVDAAKSFRHLFIMSRSPLEWLVRKIQDSVTLSTLRRIAAKGNKSRHSFEYVDKEGIFIANLPGGVDAIIKLPCGWPLVDSPLEITSLERKTRHSKRTSLTALHNVVVSCLSVSFSFVVSALRRSFVFLKEMANSLNVETRQNISIFVDCIEEILRQQKHIGCEK